MRSARDVAGAGVVVESIIYPTIRKVPSASSAAPAILTASTGFRSRPRNPIRSSAIEGD